MEFNQSFYFVIAALFYLAVGVFVFFSLFTVYILLRYGSSRTVSVTIGIVYSVFFLSVLSISFAALQSLSKAINA